MIIKKGIGLQLIQSLFLICAIKIIFVGILLCLSKTLTFEGRSFHNEQGSSNCTKHAD